MHRCELGWKKSRWKGEGGVQFACSCAEFSLHAAVLSVCANVLRCMYVCVCAFLCVCV